ncbi:LIC_10190 family membrane protein [Flavobacterium sp. XGLA_31]|uniref:LIC_10190 family membrane protein n=1 Tax=Flavobacterium sp. XGLA_31 TaxID=3447666 RepID=UPI003F3F5327
MLLILLSWVYIFLTCVSLGSGLSKWLKISTADVVFTPILGLFGVTLLASSWAFFGPISLTFHIVLFLISVFFGYQNKTELKYLFQIALTEFHSFSKSIKWLFISSSFLILAQSATLPYIIDNETYYIQTIKWLNEYGFVKGLANLHLFFGQTSAWHIAQSVYNFSFLYDRFNDLNGFCLLLANFFAFRKLQQFIMHRNKTDLLFGLFPLTYVFLFQFVNAPSPDFPVYVLSFLIFSLFLEKNESNKREVFNKIVVLAVFASFIKITAVILLLFPLSIFFSNYKTVNQRSVQIKLITTVTVLIAVIKNITLTGYPLFPLAFQPFPDLNYKIPTEIMDFFFSKSMMHSFYLPNSRFENASFWDFIGLYFFNNGINSIIAITTVVFVILGPILIYKYRLPKTIWTIYAAFIILLGLLCCSSPQYRFYVYFTLFFGLLLLALLLKKVRHIILLEILSIAVIGILLFLPVSFKALTVNPFLANNSVFHFKNILIPEPNTKYQLEFKGDSRGNMKFNTPVDSSLFWMNGNGKLPCVNSVQLIYFETNFHLMPQQRSNNLADGFYSQKLTGHD